MYWNLFYFIIAYSKRSPYLMCCNSRELLINNTIVNTLLLSPKCEGRKLYLVAELIPEARLSICVIWRRDVELEMLLLKRGCNTTPCRSALGRPPPPPAVAGRRMIQRYNPSTTAQVDRSYLSKTQWCQANGISQHNCQCSWACQHFDRFKWQQERIQDSQEQ